MDEKESLFKGRKEAIDHMILDKYPPTDIFKLWNMLHLEGWVTDDDSLPMGWKRKHMKDKHTEAGKLLTQCTFCGLQFACKGDLKRHVKENHEKPIEFNCSFCGKNFPKKPNLKIHERSHTQDKPFRCPHCSRAFAVKSMLLTHMKNLSYRQQPPCGQCGNVFYSLTVLREHQKQHANTLQCDQCEESFLALD